MSSPPTSDKVMQPYVLGQQSTLEMVSLINVRHLERKKLSHDWTAEFLQRGYWMLILM